MTDHACQACGHAFSDTDGVCPQCGHAVPDFTKSKGSKSEKNSQLLGVVVMCAGVVSCAGDEGGATSVVSGIGLFVIGSLIYYAPRLRARLARKTRR